MNGWGRFWTALLEALSNQGDHYTPARVSVPHPEPSRSEVVRYQIVPPRLLVTAGDKIRGIDLYGKEVIMVVEAIDYGVAYGTHDGEVRRVLLESIDRIYNESGHPEPVDTGIRERSTIDGDRPTVRNLRAAATKGNND